MIRAMVISPWHDFAKKLPQLYEDYTLAHCRLAVAMEAPSFAAAGKLAEALMLKSDPRVLPTTAPIQYDPDRVPVELECTYAVWEAIVHDPAYRVEWYEEMNVANPQRRIMN